MARVRRADAGDIARIVGMVDQLRAAVGGPIPVDYEWTGRMVASLIADDRSVVFVSAGGFIAGTAQPTVINPALVARELGWFASDGSGLRLLRSFETWAAEMGALMVQLSTAPENMDLSRLGYSRAELAWVR